MPAIPSSRTRLLRGARACFGALAVLALVAAAPARRAVPEFVPDPDGPGPLPWRVPGRLAFTVDAASFPDSAGTRLEVYVRVPRRTLADLGRDEQGRAHFRLEAELQGRAGGGRGGRSSQEFTLAPGDSGGRLGKVVLLPFRTRPGVHRLEVTLHDPLSENRRVGKLGRRLATRSSIRSDFLVPGPQSGREISDLEFAWSEGLAPAQSAFDAGERRMLPNPERLYGLLQPELVVAATARGPAGAVKPWRWTAEIHDATGAAVAQRDSTGEAGERLSVSYHADVSSLPAGAYTLELRAWQEGDAGALVRRAPFSIAWEPDSWSRDPGDMVDEVHLLFDRGEEERFTRMPPGEREAYLAAWWRERDPSPDTAENENRITFLQRLDFANRTWARGAIEPGMFSDMGRVFVRYGEPDDVVRQVIPTGDEDLSRAVRDLNLLGERPTGAVDQKGAGADQRPFEIWIYEGEAHHPLGTPVSEERRHRFRKRLLFLFVDEHGYGDYRLMYSTE